MNVIPNAMRIFTANSELDHFFNQYTFLFMYSVNYSSKFHNVIVVFCFFNFYLLKKKKIQITLKCIISLNNELDSLVY